MSDEQLFRVVFSGVTTGEYDLETTKTRFGKLFRLPPDKVSRLFSGKEYILKDKVIEEVAMNFGIRIAETGCECYIETLALGEGVYGSTHSPERRSGDRRVKYRRAERKGTTVSDRRITIGRRSEDQPKPAMAG